MKLSLDTHAFLWWIADDSRLSPRVRDLIAAAENEIFLSVASGIEISIKGQIGKLSLSEPPEVFAPRHMKINKIGELPIRMEHGLQVFSLPLIHRDPFDRLLIAQGQIEAMPLVTCDPLVAQYSVEIVW